MAGMKNQVSPGRDNNYQNMMEVYDPEIDDLLERMRDDRVQTEGPHEERAYSSSASEDEDTYTRPAAHLTQATGRDEQSESDSDNVVECGDAGSSGEDEAEEKEDSGAPQGLRGYSLPSPAPSSTAARVDKKKPSARPQTKGRRSGTLTSTQIDHSRPSRDNSELVPSPGNPKFFKTFITAIKTDNLRAVELMCEESKKAGVDIGESKEDFDDKTLTVSFTEGTYTATALHIALLFKRLEIVKLLISQFPNLVKIQYTSADLLGQTAFHIAAANNDLETMQRMLKVIRTTVGNERVIREINRKATGTYFEKNHQVGALCLTAALWAGHLEMVRFLLENGANMAGSGPSGNTALHQLVNFSKKYREKQKKAHDMFKLFWELCDYDISSSAEKYSEQKATHNKVAAMRKLLSIRNDNHHTPLMLAVNLQAPIAKYLLNFQPLFRQPQTKYGSTSWITYDVTEATSYDPAKPFYERYNPSSVLHILSHRAKIVSSEDQTYEDLIRVQPVSDLVKMKWKVYRWVYYLWAFFHVLNMFFLTYFVTDYRYASAKTTNVSVNAPVFNAPLTGIDNKHFAWIFLFLPAGYIILEIEDILVGIRSLRILGWGVFRNALVTGNGPFRVTLLLHSLFSFIWAFMLEFDHSDRDIPLIFSVGLGWIFMLFFTRGFKSTAQFSIMVQKMFFKDFLYFFSVYLFVWVAFVSAMQILLETQTLGDTIYSMLNIMTDAGEKTTEQISRRPILAAVILSVYAVISVILLLNMLIAMMNASYDAVKMSKTKLYRYQQLSILLLIERRLFLFKWLCERSQHHIWSPKTDEQHMKNNRAKNGDDVEKGSRNSAKQKMPEMERLTSQRMYVEVTESNFEDDVRSDER